MNIVLAVLLVIASIALIVFVLFQTGGQSSKLSQAIAGGSSENFSGKNRQRAKDKKYSNYTTGIAIGFAILLLIVTIYVNYQVNHPSSTDTTASETTVVTEDATGTDADVTTNEIAVTTEGADASSAQ